MLTPPMTQDTNREEDIAKEITKTQGNWSIVDKNKLASYLYKCEEIVTQRTDYLESLINKLEARLNNQEEIGAVPYKDFVVLQRAVLTLIKSIKGNDKEIGEMLLKVGWFGKIPEPKEEECREANCVYKNPDCPICPSSLEKKEINVESLIKEVYLMGQMCSMLEVNRNKDYAKKIEFYKKRRKEIEDIITNAINKK